MDNQSANAIIESLKENQTLIYINLKSNRIPIKVMNDINSKVLNNKLRERGNFIPKLKQEIRELSFEPGEIKLLKGRILMQNNEKKISIEKLKEDNKMIKLKKTENEKELNFVESQSDDILSKLEEIEKLINIEIELKESEMNEFNNEREILQKNILSISNELDNLNNENQLLQDKLTNINKKFNKSYNISYKKYEEKNKFLQIITEQLKYKKKKHKLNLRILDRLNNPEKFKPINENEIEKEKEIKSDEVSKRLKKIKSENNILSKGIENELFSKNAITE